VDNVNRALSELEKILQEEVELHEELISILHSDWEAYREHCPDKIRENNKKKETCLLKIRVLEESRILLVESIAEREPSVSSPPTLSQLLEVAEEPYRSLLTECRSKLLALIKGISEISKDQRRFLKHSLDYLDRSLSLIDYLGSPGTTYAGSGHIHGGKRYGQVVCSKV
jgi:hypothetical protein